MSAKTKSTTVNAKSDYVLAAIAFCVVGVLFCYSQSAITIVLSMLAIGTVLTVLGLLELINKNFIVGAIEAAIGIVLIVLACVQPDATLIMLGVAAILFGCSTPSRERTDPTTNCKPKPRPRGRGLVLFPQADDAPDAYFGCDTILWTLIK